MDENNYYAVKLAPEIVEISKVYKNENFELCDKYQAFVESINYEELFKNLTAIFPYLVDGSEYADWNSGTAGWNDALKITVGQNQIDRMFGDLEWYDCDHLDGAIEAKLDSWFREEHTKDKFCLNSTTVTPPIPGKDF